LFLLLAYNLLVGCYQVCTHKKKQLKPNRKLFPDDLSFILCGAGVGACSPWPNHTHKIKTGTTNRWELLQITNHLNQLLRLANETQEEAVRSYLLHSSLVDVRLCCAFYQPQQTLQKCGQTRMFLIFLHPILQRWVIY
jgi:hypothetical protein